MKTVLVTGGVRGIGKSISLAFVKKGYRVCAVYSRDEESAREMSALGVETYRADVSNEGEVVALFEKIGRVDILVNNAGVALVKQIQDISYESCCGILYLQAQEDLSFMALPAHICSVCNPSRILSELQYSQVPYVCAFVYGVFLPAAL